MEKFYVKRITKINKNILGDINGLLSQWYGKEYRIDPRWLAQVIKNSYLLGVYDGKNLVGIVTLIEMHKISGYKGSVEHLMVDEKYRGQKLGEKLMVYAINLAKKLKMKDLYLTCEPRSIAANALYKKLGFEKKESRVYYKNL